MKEVIADHGRERQEGTHRQHGKAHRAKSERKQRMEGDQSNDAKEDARRVRLEPREVYASSPSRNASVPHSGMPSGKSIARPAEA